MTLVNAVFCDCLVQITLTDTLMVLIDPVFNKMSGLFTMSLPTCRDVEHNTISKHVPHFSKKPEYLYRRPGVLALCLASFLLM